PRSTSNVAELPATSIQRLPATSVMGKPVAGALPAVMPVYVAADQRCPDSAAPTSGGSGDGIGEQGRLEPMLGQVLAYGGEHRDEFGTYGLVWHTAGDASVVISFTAHVDEHRSALDKLVEYPDELVVCQAALSGDANLALQALLVNELAGRFISIGQGFGSVTIELPKTEKQLAAELTARFGDIVSIKFGELPVSFGTVPMGPPGASIADPTVAGR
ncbi:MAG: hypothetical protein ACXWBO_19625, partial [Ilumatobacteraceae bacterium]